MIARSGSNGEASPTNILIIVPDQFTMQTQGRLVELHEKGGILHIDVLSFARLTHRVFEEMGGNRIPVLDDTGKSLVLQKVATSCESKLPVLGSHLRKQGYIHEVKSALSEFMQYGIAPDDLDEWITCSQKRGALRSKLEDLQTLYRAFTQYIEGHFITTEETLDVLCKILPNSKLIKKSLVVFDGFTGFTPIQERVITQIMSLSAETIVTITMGEKENPFSLKGEQELFYLSKKTVNRLLALAKEANIERGNDVYLTMGEHSRFATNEPLATLERELFRSPNQPYGFPQDRIRIWEASSLQEEVRQTGRLILEQIRKHKYAFRDIALIVGDLESYAPSIEVIFEEMGIPCFLDQTKGIVLNPMTESIKSVLQLLIKDFQAESVLRYLRSGISPLQPREVDLLEEYIVQTGIRGMRKWDDYFTRKTAGMSESEEELIQLNDLRKRFMDSIEPFCHTLSLKKNHPAKEYVVCLYEFLIRNHVQDQLLAYERRFDQAQDASRAKEYAQIYRLVIDLLDQIYALLGEEPISLQDFADILQAGFGEIRVGAIPQSINKVLVGDVERTRLKQVKTLFFLGVNDGNIPKGAKMGGIVSDIDREFLRESGMELAPTPREQMFIQKLYLYMNVTKPSEYLYLSYSRVTREGKAIRPSYLIDLIRKLFLELSVEIPQTDPVCEQITTYGQGLLHLANELREYVAGRDNRELFTLYTVYGQEQEARNKRERIQNAAFSRYQETGLSKAIAQALFSMKIDDTYVLENSISRLETYAACAYRHFMEYGLSLKERSEFSFESVDMGTVYHEVLARFSNTLENSPYTWFNFTEEYAEQSVDELLTAYASQYKATVLYDNARNEYAVTRMKRILTKTVLTLKEQLAKGVFVPDAFELSFASANDMKSVTIALSAEEKMILRGRVDRIDIAQSEDKVYVKVIDYKSGPHQFDLAALYHGLQLQLVVYMNAAMEMEARKHPDKEIIPAALLYYHIEDPTVETQTELSDEELHQLIAKKLRMMGVVNEAEDVIAKIDQTMTDRSDVVVLDRKKDGTFSSTSNVMSRAELDTVSTYVSQKIKQLGTDILDGRITLDPYERQSSIAPNACTFCPYRKSCGFDPSIPGYRMRELPETDKATLMQEMGKS
jgi:ATP-dependent helicase/nuclease subunit B